MCTPLSRPVLLAALGLPCPYCGEPMQFPERRPSRDHIEPRSRGGTLAPDNRAIVCQRCNTDKGSRSLGRWVYRLCRAGDPRARRIAAFALHRGVDPGQFLDTDPLHAYSVRGIYPPATLEGVT
jgi:hypothetical protein